LFKGKNECTFILFFYLPSISFHTIPSKLTCVPGSHGPKQSGSVTVPTLMLVPTQASAVSWKCIISNTYYKKARQNYKLI